MAGASLLALLDDIASVLDDISVMTKVAAKKTAGILGDDLALNAEQVSGVVAVRELPVVWAVAKGSFINKAVLIPAALLISTLASWLITPLLMIGGAYLCFEGAEKLLHKFTGHCPVPKNTTVETEEGISENIAGIGSIAGAYEEKIKIKGAIRTDFILSAEIIVIALGSIPSDISFAMRAAVLVLIGIFMTVGVYGLVATIVKLDDCGVFLVRRNPNGGIRNKIGVILVDASPKLMRSLSIIGTVAMFMVGGGILIHGIPWLHQVTDALATYPLSGLSNMLLNAFGGLVAGVLLCIPVLCWEKLHKLG